MVPLNQESYNNAINSKFCWRVLHPSNEWWRISFTGAILGAIHLNRNRVEAFQVRKDDIGWLMSKNKNEHNIIYTIVDLFVFNRLIMSLFPLKQNLTSYTIIKKFMLNVRDNMKIYINVNETNKINWFWFWFKTKSARKYFGLKKYAYFI